MNAPDFDRVIETFIRTPIPENANLGQMQQAWGPYMDLLRNNVAPLVNELMDKGVIDWYSFLVHTKNSVPTTGAGSYVLLSSS